MAYSYLEDWSPLDTAYFLTVEATTVGYGDFCPETVLGKLFTTMCAASSCPPASARQRLPASSCPPVNSEQ